MSEKNQEESLPPNIALAGSLTPGITLREAIAEVLDNDKDLKSRQFLQQWHRLQGKQPKKPELTVGMLIEMYKWKKMREQAALFEQRKAQIRSESEAVFAEVDLSADSIPKEHSTDF